MLSKKQLVDLRNKLPRNYASGVIDAYEKTTGKKISKRSVFAFLAGDTYSVELHNATLYVAESNSQRLRILEKRTDDLIK